MPNNIAAAHDRFVRRSLEDLKLARDFFKKFLAVGVQKQIDLNNLEPKKENFVVEHLDTLTTDLLFQAPIEGHPAYLSLLIEHKSEGAARGDGNILPFQMRKQEIMIMENERRNHPKKRYPLVHMVGLFHGQRPYAGPRSVGEHIDAPSDMVPSRWREPMTLIDLSAFSDEDLMAEGKLGVFLLILKHIYSEDILTTLKALGPNMQAIEQKHGGDFIVTVFRYLYEASRVENKDAVDHIAKETFSKETGAEIMTIAEKLKEEGREEGLQEGSYKKAVEVARRMISLGNADEQIQLVTELSLAEIRVLREDD